jgi:hypothetical protein
MQSVSDLQAWLGQLQEHWDTQLQAFKDHVEGQR